MNIFVLFSLKETIFVVCFFLFVFISFGFQFSFLTCPYADFDEDGFIGRNDLLACLTTMTRNELSPEEHQQIADKVMEEADVDGDGKLSFLEFEHVILRAPDFLSTFHIRI